MDSSFTVAYNIAGTLGGNHTIEFKFPFDVSLVHVSLSNSTTTDATVDIGYTGATAAYLSAAAVGDSEVAAELKPADFVGGASPHILKSTNIIVSIDYDGSGGTAADDFCIVMTFTPG